MTVTRTGAAILALAVLTMFFVIRNISNATSGAARSSRAIPRTVSTASVDSTTTIPYQSVLKALIVPPPTSSKSVEEDRSFHAKRRRPIAPSSTTTAFVDRHRDEAVVTNATKSATVVKDGSKPIRSKYRAHNVSTDTHVGTDVGSTTRMRRLNKNLTMFRKRLTQSEFLTLTRMFRAVTGALRARNVTFWMDGSTLLGSYRHHDVIPWDDDVDLVVWGRQKSRARRAIKALAPAYQLYVEKDAATSTELVWRVYPSKNSVAVSRKNYRFPTVDVHFYSQNSTHVQLEPRNLWWYLTWPKGIVFPLHLRPFNEYWAPAPCNTLRYLITEFDQHVMNICWSPRTLHRQDIRVRRTAIRCRRLTGVPIVDRTRARNGMVTETLKRGNEVIQRHVIQRKC